MQSNQSSNQPSNILIIDDTPDNLRFLSDLLSKAGYSIRKVTNGQMGLEAARSDPPDLVLLDIRMPGLNGYGVCDQLKSTPNTAQIPVIFLSAMSEELDKVMAFEAGGVDYITKPFQPVEVLARIGLHLQVSRLRQKLQHQNAQLQEEIDQRASAETAFSLLNQDLNSQVQARTAELQNQNQQLLHQLAELQQALTQTQRRMALQQQALVTIEQELKKASATLSASLDQASVISMGQQWIQPVYQTMAMLNQVSQEAGRFTAPAVAPAQSERAWMPLTQFCRDLFCQWALPDQPTYHLTVVVWGRDPGLVEIDQAQFRQMLSELLTNAIRYSPQGGTILLQLTYEPDQVLLQLRDEGIGIPAAEVNRVVDRFYRASNAAFLPGNGEGLALVQQIVAQQQGRLEINSMVNQGTTVTVTLPLAQSPTAGGVD